MKKILLILMLFFSFYANSQTVLTAGDIAFVGSNTDGVTNPDDNISFVLLKDIDAATTIIFTDMGWNDTTGFFAVAGDGQFTWTSGIARTAGQVVTLDMAPLMPAAYSIIGDQLFAIQGTIAAPIFIAGIQHNDTATSDDANWDGAATTNSTSALPNALVTGDTAVRLIPEQDNWQFSCALAGGSPVTGTPAQIRAIVNNRANWNGNNDTVYNPAFPAGCIFTITTGGDTTPPVIVCAPTPAPITAGINGLAAIPDLVTGTTATDDVSSPANITITQSPTAGTMVGVGVNTVTLTATDEAGNSASCTIDVTVNEPPFTPLAPGDIAFVGFNLDGNDTFAFIILKDIIAGTNIKLTDCGVTNPNSITCVGAGGEGSATWYAPSAMSAGDIVTLPGSFINGAVLSISGDQLFAYQGTAANPNFITGIHANIEPTTTDADWDGANTNNATTALPDQLTNGVNAIRVYAAGPPQTEVDNWQFDCTLVPGGFPITGTAVELAAIINDIQYWVSNDAVEYTPAAKAGCIYNVLPPDTTPPTAVCQDITVQLDGTGSVTIVATDVDGGSTDNVGIVSYAIDIDTFDCSNVGTPVSVTLTVTDAAGLFATCTAMVTVEDNVAPTAVCQAFTAQLDATGNVTITGADVDGGSTDACGIASLSVSPSSFTCAEIGPNTVTLTITDVNGNSSTCTATVTVEDNVAPTAICQNTSVFLDATGNATITAADINNGSTDNCGIASVSVSPSNFTCAEIGNNTVTLTVTDVNGNVSTCTSTVTVVDDVDPIATCQDITVALDAAGNATIIASDVDNGSTDNCGILSRSISPSAFTCSDIGANTVTLTITDVNGNVATCTSTVTITDPLSACNQSPIAVCQPIIRNASGSCQANAAAIEFDGGSTDPDGDPLIFTVNPVGPYPIGVTNVTLTVSDGTLTDSCTTTITVVDNTPPIANCVAPFTIQLDASGNASITAADINNGSTDNCGIASTTIDIDTFDCSNVGANTVTLTVTDISGNTSTCTTTVTVEDSVAPTAVCQNITVQLDANGDATISPAAIDGGSSDNCGIASLQFTDQLTAFAEVNEGQILTISLPVGRVVTSVDFASYGTPNGSSGNYTIGACHAATSQAIVESYALGNNSFSIPANNLVFGDPCNGTVKRLYVSVSSAVENNSLTFGCADVGINDLTLLVTDTNGNTATCTATITVEDNIAPTAVCQNITVQLDAAGNATITAADVDGGSSDACGIASTSIDISTFDCSNVGTNNVVLTVTDNNGNVSTCTAVVTVEDNIAPVANCAAPFTIQLDANGNASITVADIENGSTDNCGIATTTIDIDAFDCSNVGDNTVTLTVTDVNGNVSTCTTIVTVEDNVAPVANCAAPFTIQLDANGNATITAADIDNGSTDACGIASTTIDITDFDCSNIGDNTVTLTVTDVNGNVSTCTTIVTVEDNLAPTIVCPTDITANTDAGDCFATVNFPMPIAFDNCGIDTIVQTAGLPSGSQFPVGVNTIEFTATDVNGNTSSCSFTVTVTDNEAPLAVCQNITIQLDANGNATITAADVDGGSTDQCGVASISIDMDTFDCSHVGDNNVNLSVTDLNGNVSSCTAIVTVEDVTAPVVACQNMTVELDPVTGTFTIAGTDIDNGSTDACGIVSYELDIDTFDCSNIGDNTVTLTVTDVNGNAASCTAIVTVEDSTAPVLVCQDFTLELGQDGTATLDPSDVIASNDDACGIFTIAVNITEFSCADIGTPLTVQVFSQDSNGNLATCTATVTVVDALAPVVTCPADQTVDPGAGNLFYILPDYFGTGAATATDNCTDPITITSQDPAPGTALPDGTYTITLTATDAYGNVGSCGFELIVDTILGAGGPAQDLGSVSLYPVPTKHLLNIGNPQNLELESLEIFDLRGRLVQRADLRGMGSKKTLDVSTLSAAVYMVRIQGQNGTTTKRLVKE